MSNMAIIEALLQVQRELIALPIGFLDVCNHETATLDRSAVMKIIDRAIMEACA